jgi:hypothetical protein
MSESAPTLTQLRLSYERYLLAKVQLIELKSWGESTGAVIHKTVSDHQAMEKAYVEDMVAKRRAHAADKRGGDSRRHP